MRYTVLLVPADAGWIAAVVPAMPGCVSQGRTRETALENAREAMAGWLELESEQGRGPLAETPELILGAVADALQGIEEMRSEGELPSEASYDLELIGVAPSHLAVVS